ncbi:MAG TPA: hypothetical protein VKE94_24480, partial [Gemmataceae bacterium]|nr:hypothetical protein [Gemmataceae bacterium]
TDSTGNTYITGAISQPNPYATTAPVDFDPSSGVPNVLAPGGYVAKYSRSGALLWAIGADQPTSFSLQPDNTYIPSGGGSQNGIATDGSGNVFVVGSFSGQVTFGSISLASTTDNSGNYQTNIFVAKLDANGNYVWVQTFAASNATGIALDSTGNAYVTGAFGRQATFGSFTVSPPGGVSDTFIVKLNTSGTVLWADGIGNTVVDNGADGVGANGIAVDGNGNAYIAGGYTGTVDFDPGTGTYDLTSMNRRGGYPSEDIFVMKVNTNGGFLWADSMGSASTYGDYANAIAVDGAGNVLITGTFASSDFSSAANNNDFDPGKGTYKLNPSNGHGFVEKLDTNGKFVWALNLNAQPFTIATDSSGNVYVGGAFQGTVDFNPGTRTYNLTSAGGNDGFVLELNSSGSFIAAVDMGGTGNDGVNAIVIDPLGDIYATGVFQQTATFGSTSLTSNGGADIFVAKLQ